MSQAQALCYPYVQIRDVRWLKATLLAFGGVARLLPPWVRVQDAPEISEFTEIPGEDGGPLLRNVAPDSPSARAAEADVLDQLTKNREAVVRECSRMAAERLGSPHEFQVNGTKLGRWVEFLRGENLVWKSPGAADGWFAMHPRLGSAILSTLAAAVARDRGLRVVTDLARSHDQMLDTGAADQVEHLLRANTAGRASQAADPADAIGHVTVLTHLDVRRLTAAQVAQMLRDGKDLRPLRRAMEDVASDVAHEGDPALRATRLRQGSARLRGEWETFRTFLPEFAANALPDRAASRPPDTLVAGLLGSSPAAFDVADGFGVAFRTSHALSQWRQRREAAGDVPRCLSLAADRCTSLTVSRRA